MIYIYTSLKGLDSFKNGFNIDKEKYSVELYMHENYKATVHKIWNVLFFHRRIVIKQQREIKLNKKNKTNETLAIREKRDERLKGSGYFACI